MPHLGNASWQIDDATHSSYLSRDLEYEVASACRLFNEYPNEPFTTIPGVVNQDGLALLNELPIPKNGECPVEALLAHNVGKVLVSIMGRISLSNTECDLQPERVAASLKNEFGKDVELAPHRDLLDGHAVIYNWNVEGDLSHTIDGYEIPIVSNQIVAINGSANWQEVTAAVYDERPVNVWEFGGTTAVHSVIGRGITSRNRLLVYADGRETNFTQLFADDYGPRPDMADNLLFIGLRPSFGIYIE